MGKAEMQKKPPPDRPPGRDAERDLPDDMHEADRDDDSSPRAAASRAAVSPAASPLEIYKPGQGAVVRWGTAVGAGVLALGGASFLYEQLSRFESLWVRYLLPVAFLALVGAWLFHMLARQRKVVDFMIATESEMRKVNWSTRKEVFGATRVVIITVLTLGLILFIVDILFMAFFEGIGVLKIRMFSQLLSRLFGG
jgi:preprotein translocase SecE subunit